nr:hypothetical protein [Tanacetum cinerariifolium]
YTDISSPFEELSDIGSPRADDHEHLMLPEILEDPYVEDDDDDMDIEADEEEKEHPAPADSVVVNSTAADQAPSTEETEPFETDESALGLIQRLLDCLLYLPHQHHHYPLAPPLSPIRSLGYRAAMIRLRDEAASTSSPPLQLPSASRREDRPEVTLPP